MAKFCTLSKHPTKSELNSSWKRLRGDNKPSHCGSVSNPLSDSDSTHTSLSSSASSSIGRNSSCTSLASPARASDDEAESRLHEPLKNMSSLTTFLPPRIGLSRFIGGKSQSFTCLNDIFSMKDLSKPENPYAKRRRPFKHGVDAFRRRRFSSRHPASGISKKSVYSSKNDLAVALAMALQEKDTPTETLVNPCDISRGVAEKSPRPRSFSMAYLQQRGPIFSTSNF